nr:hypothetical protein [Fodinicola feengrottensis]
MDTSQTAGNASSSPTPATTVGRSPRTRPTSAGTPAATTPDSGATTLIRPRARPR